jgi:hypothetical protein
MPQANKYRRGNPVPEGWGKAAWYRSYNATNSRIRTIEGQPAAVAARHSGRTREEAKAEKEFYSNSTGVLYIFLSTSFFWVIY